MKTAGFWLYQIFIFSWFVHLPSRFPVLGVIRFDFILVILLIGISVLCRENHGGLANRPIRKLLFFLIGYIIITLPFVQWPGSVLGYGFLRFFKAAMFYFFSVKFVQTEKQLKVFIGVFLVSQTLRVIEPLYLHVTVGYWGSFASMAEWEFMNRLAGAPHDIVNPNGLAFVIDSLLPFYYYLSRRNKKMAFLSLIIVPLLVWALVLTGSRTGLLGLATIFAWLVWKSRHKAKLVFAAIVCCCLIFSFLSVNQKDRYLSIVSSDTKNAATVQARFDGIKDNFMVAMRKPLFGHGLGTSLEANANYGKAFHPAHNLYAEVSQELGFLGLIVFVLFMIAIIKVLFVHKNEHQSDYALNLKYAVQAYFIMNLMFSLASYGLTGYEWYLIAGIAEVLVIQKNRAVYNKNIKGDVDDAPSRVSA